MTATQSTRHHFVFVNPCGCPVGVASVNPEVPTEYDAWKEMYGRAADIRKAQTAGVTVVHVDHATYEADFYPRMLGAYQCPHN